MEKIEHTTVATNGINMHVASIGITGSPTILFLHGFPELWYTWRHQMLSLSSQGFRCIAPDLRGYGDTDVPSGGADKYTSFHVVGDLVGLLDSLGIEKVLLVGHDWGAIIAWHFCLFRPERITALVNTSVPFMPRHPKMSFLGGLKAVFGDDFYMCRFQHYSIRYFMIRVKIIESVWFGNEPKEPGETEEEFGSVETEKLMAKILTSRNPDPPCLPKEIGWRAIPDPPSLPNWLTEQDVQYYAAKFDKTSFTGALNYYRAIDLTWELMGPWAGAKVKVPTKFIVGELDLTLKFPRMDEYVLQGGMKRDVPLLEQVVVLKDVAHFLNQESPDEVTKHIYDFFKDK
ncbi:Epoxide hydrolase A [Linum grandiflorum]